MASFTRGDYGDMFKYAAATWMRAKDCKTSQARKDIQDDMTEIMDRVENCIGQQSWRPDR